MIAQWRKSAGPRCSPASIPPRRRNGTLPRRATIFRQIVFSSADGRSRFSSALALLADEFTAQGKAELFTALRPFLGFGPEPERRYEKVAPTLGMPVGTVKNQVFRLRKRWREIIFEEVAMTLTDATPEEIKGELAELLGSV